MSKIHKCNGVLVQCIDWRIQNTLAELLKSLNIETADRVSIPGGAGKQPQLVDEWCDLSCKLHEPNTIVLTVHEDCGAGATKDDLIKAFNRTKQKHSNRTVRAFFVNLDGSWEELD
ncbi:MAG: carbonic anhydrase [Parcubacteria group bacterium]